MAEEVDKEHKKMLDKYSQQAEEMKASYKKLMTDVQSSSARGTAASRGICLSEFYCTSISILLTWLPNNWSVCKVTLPEMGKSVARAIDGLRSRYNIPATTA
ncbi:hypothetical protein TRIUR3_26884 [Triticum urartu]|uniref:Uncharacterized protein n=1 Tax=Triticum urartu TaxID=4572 RepID=M7ZLR8_TRIUA|nr:hypothetical protein TRIUR3_26884 [Triticum urartu]